MGRSTQGWNARRIPIAVASLVAALALALPGVAVPGASASATEPAPRKGCFSARGIPRCGAYLGQAYGANDNPAPLEKRYGRRLGVHRTYFRADQVNSAVIMARGDLRHGRLPWVSFKLPHSWDAMARGAGDRWARRVAARFGRLHGPVWLAFHHEPEGEGPMGDWRRMQERLAPIVRARDNLAMTVIVMGYHEFYGEAKYRMRNIWPRGVKIDVAGFDIYNQLGVVKYGEENTEGTNLQRSYFSKIAPWARRHNVAWGLAETGITHKAAKRHPHWIRQTHGRLERAGGVAMSYFNTTLNSIAPWMLTTRPKRVGWREAQTGTPLLPRR